MFSCVHVISGNSYETASNDKLFAATKVNERQPVKSSVKTSQAKKGEFRFIAITSFIYSLPNLCYLLHTLLISLVML
jgi:hypothetical protein